MIAFRQVDARYPFLWEDASQPAGRWHADGEGPAHYFADTPDGAWAEFLRHEEITDLNDVKTIRRRMWAVEIGDPPTVRVDLSIDILTGGPETYPGCQEAVRAIRDRGGRRVAAVTAALKPGGAHGSRIGLTIVIFGPPDELLGWVAGEEARPSVDLLDRVNHYDQATPAPGQNVRKRREGWRAIDGARLTVRRRSSRRRAACS